MKEIILRTKIKIVNNNSVYCVVFRWQLSIKKFYNNETEYSDGSIEDEILNMVKNTDDFESILDNDLRWPVFYHLSYLRENLFNWYPFNEDSNLLEIGAGCGALTGLFCDKVSKVIAVELTDRRSQIIYNRHKDCPNLEIFPGNLNNMDFEEKFDYIILCGVLEYASLFTQTNNPHVDFLKKIKSMLSEDGVILVAIENRIGLKYFSGSKEDHLSRCFIGIDNYPDIDPNDDPLGKYVDEIIYKSFRKYKNRQCLNCTSLLSKGLSAKNCNKKHHIFKIYFDK